MKKFVLLLSCGLALCACNTNELEFDNLEVQPINGVFGVPLGEISYTLGDLLDEAGINDEALQEDDETTLLSLTYSDELSYTNQDEFIQIDDITGSGSITNSNVRTPVANPTQVTVPEVDFVQPYDPQDGEELDSVFYAGGQATVNIVSNANVSSVTIRVIFQNTLDLNTRNPLTISGTVDNSGTGTFVQNLANHVTILSGNTNDFTVTFGAILNLEPGEQLTGGETLTFDFTLGNQTFTVVYGKFGQNQAQVGNETLEFDFFSDLDGGIFFDAPTLRFNFESTFGIPLALDFSGLSSDDGNGGNQVFLGGSITREDNLPEIAAAPDINSSSTSTIEISPANSTIRNLFATSPSRLLFNVTGISNYYDSDNSESNFVEPDNSVSATVELEMPIAVRLEDFQESFQFDLNGGLDIDNVDSAFLRVVTVNGIPFSGTLVMEVRDENDEVIVTIPESVVVNTPFINIDGIVTDPNGSSVDIPLSKEAIDAFGVGTNLNMILTLNTPETVNSNEIYVEVRANYKLDITVGLGGLVNIDI